MKSLIFLALCLTFLLNTARACSNPKIGGSSDWYPFAYFDHSQQKVRGTAYQFSAILAKHMNWDPIYPTIYIPWSRSVKHLRSGKLDIIAGIYNTKKRQRYMLFSKPYTHIATNIYVKKDKVFKFQQLKDLAGKIGGRVLGGAAGGGIDDHPQEFKFVEVHDRKQLFEMLIRDRIDYIPFTEIEARPLIKLLRIENQITKLPKPLADTPVTIAISKRSSCIHLMPKINRFIERYHFQNHHLEQHNLDQYLNN